MSDTQQAIPLTVKDLQNAVSSSAAFRCRRRLQPGGGAGDKVFPPTFAGAVYAVEQRRVPDRPDPVTCVVLDTVQSQANRMELALQEAFDAGKLNLPILQVDFTPWSPTGDVEADKSANRLVDAVGKLTSLQVPHRLADAILRDCEVEEIHDGKKVKVPFRQSAKGKALNTINIFNATALYQLCPTALVFGMWDSAGPKGGLGAKFERALVSEVVGIGVTFGIRTTSRIDPLITKTQGIVLYEKKDGTWTLDENTAKKDSKTGKPVLVGKQGKVSEANLGNVTPAFAKYTKGAEGLNPLKTEPFALDYRIAVGRDELEIRNHANSADRDARQGDIAPGGVTLEYAEQLTTLSLIVLRRLRFPSNGKTSPKSDLAGQTVLAALGLCAATLAFEAGMGLRSRCLLWPEGPMTWELLARPGEAPKSFSLTAEQAVSMLQGAVDAAKKSGLTWEEKPVLLQPQQKLVELIRLSQFQATEEGAEGGD
jgi:CRISPR-associated protein Csb1